jgi:AcrR family transcriptional regulator
LTEHHDFPQRWREAQGFDATREVLRDAAYDIIRTKGLDDLNMRGLAARVGASAMAAYRYYPGKEFLVEDIRSQVTIRFAEALRDAATRADDPVGRFRNMCVAYLEYAIGNEQEYRLMFGAVASPKAEDTGRKAPAWEALLQVLDHLPRPDGDASIVDHAHLVWGSLHGVAMLHLSKRLIFGRSIEDLAEPTLVFLLDALRVPAASATFPARSA